MVNRFGLKLVLLVSFFFLAVLPVLAVGKESGDVRDSALFYIDQVQRHVLVNSINSSSYSTSMPLCGDANNDGSVTVSDIVFLFNYCFKNGSAPPNPANADVDGASSITVRDVDYLVSYLFKSGPLPNCSRSASGYRGWNRLILLVLCLLYCQRWTAAW